MATPDRPSSIRSRISPNDIVTMEINGRPAMATVVSADLFTGKAVVRVTSEFDPNRGQSQRTTRVGTFYLHDLHPLATIPARSHSTYWNESE